MSAEFAALRARFPKTRPGLPAAYEALYEKEYKRNRGSHNRVPDLKQRLEHWMHARVAHTPAPNGPLLELGAGTLNHVDWERADCAYDIVEPFTALYQDQRARAHLSGVYPDIDAIPLEPRYAKILSVAVLEHLEELPRVVARSALLLREDGVAAHGIPSEGGLFWYLAWRFGTGLSFRLRTGLSYATLMHHEHVNDASEILSVLRIFFGEVSVRHFPLPFLHGSFYTCVTVRQPDRQKAQRYLAGNP